MTLVRRMGICLSTILLFAAVKLHAAEKTETFDRDPGWEGHNNLPAQACAPSRAVSSCRAA